MTVHQEIMEQTFFKTAVLGKDKKVVQIAFPKDASIPELLASLYPYFRQKLEGGFKHWIVDLASMPFPTTSVIAFLISATEQARYAGGDVKLINAGDSVRNNLVTFSPLTYLTIIESQATALADFQQDGSAPQRSELNEAARPAWSENSPKTAEPVRPKTPPVTGKPAAAPAPKAAAPASNPPAAASPVARKPAGNAAPAAAPRTAPEPAAAIAAAPKNDTSASVRAVSPNPPAPAAAAPKPPAPAATAPKTPVPESRTNDNRFYLRTESIASHLYKICDFVVEHAQRAGMEEKQIVKSKISVYEACLNVIEHAYHSRPDNWIEVWVEYDKAKFKITIQDYGLSFESKQEPQNYDVEAAMEKRQTGGFGLHIIERSMDEVTYVADPENGNRLTLTKLL